MLKQWMLVLCLFCSSTLFADVTPHQVLDFWFGPLNSAQDYPTDKVKAWFIKDANFDNTIRVQFEDSIQAAAKGNLDHWKATPEGNLALIVLLDQMTRNIYRNTPEAFAYDPIAQEITLTAIKNGDDQKVLPLQRVFFYMPLEHAENLDLQNQSVAAFKRLVDTVPSEVQHHFKSFYEYAIAHQRIIERFGRFPHRNQILDRDPTTEEIKFLKQPGSSF